MAKLTIKTQKVFCDVTPANKLGVFGSYAAGAAAYSNDPDTLQSLTAFGAGLGSALVNNAPPAIQDIDGLGYLFSRQIAYLMQTGIPEWNASVTYYTGSIVNDGTGALYISVADDNLNNAISVLAKWKLYRSKKVRLHVSWNLDPAYDDYIVEMNGANNEGYDPLLVYLPTPSALNAGRIIIIKNLFSGGIQIYANDSSTIDGANYKGITGAYTKASFISNGTNWEIIG
jgi:hypothetical protein